MELLNKITPMLRRGSQGKALLTLWRGDNCQAAANFQENLNLELLVCGDRAAQENLHIQGVSSVYGDFLSDIEGTHQQFSLVIVPGPAIMAHAPPKAPDTFQRDFRHLRAAQAYLAAGGWMIFQTTRNRVREYSSWTTQLIKSYANLQAFSLAEDEIIFVGQRRPAVAKLDIEARDRIKARIEHNNLPSIPPYPVFRIPKATASKGFFRSRKFDPHSIDSFMQSIPWGKNQLLRELKGWQQPVIRPAFRLRARHLSYMVASGVLGTMEASSPVTGEDCIIRGVMRREEIASPNPKDAEEEMLTSTVKASIILLNIPRKTLTVVDPDDAQQIKAFLDEWAEALIAQIESKYPVIYDPVDAPYYETFHPYLTRMIDRPLREGTVNLTSSERASLTIPQRHLVATALRCLLGRWALQGNQGDPEDTGAKSFFLQGKQGVGKSIMAARIIEGITLEYAHRKGLKITQPGWPVSVIITVPGVIDEMVKEIKTASRLLEPCVVTNTGELFKALAHVKTNPRPMVMVIPRSMLSQSQNLIPATCAGNPAFHDQDQQHPRMLCPNCMDVVSMASPTAFLEAEDLLKHPRNIKTRGMKCRSCNTPLYQEARKTRWLCHHCGHELPLDNLTRCPACRKKVKDMPHNPYQLGSVIRKAFRKAGIKPLALVVDEVHEGAPRGVCG